MHFLKEGKKIWAWVDPPPLIRAMPERKRFFSIEVFPYTTLLVEVRLVVEYDSVKTLYSSNKIICACLHVLCIRAKQKV